MTTMAKMKRVKGEPREVFVYRYLPPTTTGQSRKWIGNFTVVSDLDRILRAKGPGRYRLEWRDDHRWIVEVKIRVVRREGRVVEGRPLLPPRKVGPPRDLPSAETLERRRLRSMRRQRE